jgi:cystathionine beta-lyase
MRYDFDAVVDRKGTHSIKWDLLPEGAPEDALPLWVADMDFSCAEPILKALHERIDRKIFGYTLYESREYKDAVTAWYKRRMDWDVAAEDIFFSPGVVPAIAFLIDCLTAEGDGIVIQRPVYYPFTNKIEANKRKVVNNPLVYENGAYRIDYDDLDAKMSLASTKGMILCSPHNPVGRVWKEEELKNIVNICRKYNKWIISDEIHGDLVRKHIAHIPLEKACPDYKDKIITCTAPSKTFNLAGMQLSNIVIPNKEHQKLWKDCTSNRFSIDLPNPLGLAALIAAYTEGEDWLEQLKTYLDQNAAFCRRFFEEKLPKAKTAEPEGTYLLWVDLRAYCGDYKKLQDTMFHKAKVALDEGYIFGKEGAGFERINFACPKSVLENCLNRMEKALNSL